MRLEHKRGDTLIWECEYTDDAGVPVNLTTYEIKCQARSAEGVELFNVGTATTGITVTNTLAGTFRVQVDATDTFNLGRYDVDIQYTIGTLIKSSETFSLEIVKDITK